MHQFSPHKWWFVFWVYHVKGSIHVFMAVDVSEHIKCLEYFSLLTKHHAIQVDNVSMRWILTLVGLNVIMTSWRMTPSTHTKIHTKFCHVTDTQQWCIHFLEQIFQGELSLTLARVKFLTVSWPFDTFSLPILYESLSHIFPLTNNKSRYPTFCLNIFLSFVTNMKIPTFSWFFHFLTLPEHASHFPYLFNAVTFWNLIPGFFKIFPTCRNPGLCV